MSWIAPTALSLEILLLLYVAMIDIATRLIRNEICLVLALLGIVSQCGCHKTKRWSPQVCLPIGGCDVRNLSS